ncbi:MAG: hypothetical protein WAM28_06250 [Chlamydiales bacterium]
MKRLFIGVEVKAPWPLELPSGRIIEESHRHLTLAFLGKTDYEKLQKSLNSFPLPTFKVGVVGKFDQCLFLPPRHSRVVAWHIEWFDEKNPLKHFYDMLIQWLQKEGLNPDTRHSFSPHVTLCRSPFNETAWKKAFTILPLFLKDIHLYESLGSSKYQSLWSYPLLTPFQEIEHTADIAFNVFGESFDELYRNALTALAFKFPPLIPFATREEGLKSLEDVVMALNNIVYCADKEIGCPFKAVSFHSDLEKKENIFKWVMIIDV